MWLKIPFRNLTRNPRRTVLSLAIIGLGAALSFAVLGFVGSSIDIIQNGLLRRYGNIQIARKEVWTKSRSELNSPLDPKLVSEIERVLKTYPEVKKYGPQLSFTGLLVSGVSSNPVTVIGVVPDNEIKNYGNSLVRGSGLEEKKSDSALVGQTLADKLSLSPGSRIRLIVNKENGGQSTDASKVKGVYTAQSEEVEARQVYISIGSARSLVGADITGKILVELEDRDATDRIARELDRKFSQISLPVEVRTWKELSSFYKTLRSFFGLIFGFLIVVVSALVFFIVLQVLTMSFLERSREVGTIRALGTRRLEVFRTFLVESFLLGSAGALLGILAGVAIAVGFNALGINWTPPGSVEQVVLTVNMGWANIWPPVLISLVATVLSAFYPAYRMAKTDIVEALRVEE